VWFGFFYFFSFIFSMCASLCVRSNFLFYLFQHVCNLLSFVFITMINKCITHALMLWLVMMIESLCHVKI